MAGDFLPPQLIYQGKTSRCQPQHNFPKEFHVTQTNNHWANEQTSLDYLEHVPVPYVNQHRKELSSTSPWLLISDVFKGQWTEPVKEAVRRSNGKMVPVPGNWTSCFLNDSRKDW